MGHVVLHASVISEGEKKSNTMLPHFDASKKHKVKTQLRMAIICEKELGYFSLHYSTFF